jgi:hypothetical protein
VDQVLPTVLEVNNTGKHFQYHHHELGGPVVRHLRAGPFTKNDQLTASPFTDAFLHIADIPLGVASAVLLALKGEGVNGRRELEAAVERNARGDVETQYRRWLEEMNAHARPERRAVQNLTLGYVTEDVGPFPCSHAQKLIYHTIIFWAFPGVGDDTLHTPLPFFGRQISSAQRHPRVPMTQRSTWFLWTLLGARCWRC